MSILYTHKTNEDGVTHGKLRSSTLVQTTMTLSVYLNHLSYDTLKLVYTSRPLIEYSIQLTTIELLINLTASD